MANFLVKGTDQKPKGSRPLSARRRGPNGLCASAGWPAGKKQPPGRYRFARSPDRVCPMFVSAACWRSLACRGDFPGSCAEEDPPGSRERASRRPARPGEDSGSYLAGDDGLLAAPTACPENCNVHLHLHIHRAARSSAASLRGLPVAAAWRIAERSAARRVSPRYRERRPGES